MIGDRYEAVDDPACYPGSDVLINIPDLKDAGELEQFEVEHVGMRSVEGPPEGNYDTAHYRALHRYLFQDVYEWAGEYRTIRTSKGGNLFCLPEFISSQMEALFKGLQSPPFLAGSDPDDFIVVAAEFLGDVNHIHPFREGNGRTQLIFLRMLGLRAEHPFRPESVEPEAFLRAMIESFHGHLDALVDELERMRA
ncbi:Fic family protein [Sphingomonas sediminicola]|uniref:Fic/DOC family protein n=1 Tax=Sphingomonas sediminicola TaxID=386874 RepID=UPI003CE7D08B